VARAVFDSAMKFGGELHPRFRPPPNTLDRRGWLVVAHDQLRAAGHWLAFGVFVWVQFFPAGTRTPMPLFLTFLACALAHTGVVSYQQRAAYVCCSRDRHRSMSGAARPGRSSGSPRHRRLSNRER
jgi:hypothetical protein